MVEEELFARALRSLGSGNALPPDELPALSHLDPQEAVAFGQVWDRLSTEDRRRLLRQLSERERGDLRRDFNAVYRHAFDDPDPSVRREAVESIVEDTSPSLLERLVGLAAADPDVGVREAALRGLAPFALRGELGELSPDQTELVADSLLSALRREGEAAGPRREALAGLGYLNRPELPDEIRRGLGDPELRLGAVRAMGRTADVAWLDGLAREAASDDPRMREEAARACGELADGRAVAVVADLVDDPVIDVRLAAIGALGQIGGDQAREALLYAVEDKRAPIREAAGAALGELEFADDPLSPQ
jgi:HEAT repeat protein